MNMHFLKSYSFEQINGDKSSQSFFISYVYFFAELYIFIMCNFIDSFLYVCTCIGLFCIILYFCFYCTALWGHCYNAPYKLYYYYYYLLSHDWWADVQSPHPTTHQCWRRELQWTKIEDVSIFLCDKLVKKRYSKKLNQLQVLKKSQDMALSVMRMGFVKTAFHLMYFYCLN